MKNLTIVAALFLSSLSFAKEAKFFLNFGTGDYEFKKEKYERFFKDPIFKLYRLSDLSSVDKKINLCRICTKDDDFFKRTSFEKKPSPDDLWEYVRDDSQNGPLGLVTSYEYKNGFYRVDNVKDGGFLWIHEKDVDKATSIRDYFLKFVGKEVYSNINSTFFRNYFDKDAVAIFNKTPKSIYTTLLEVKNVNGVTWAKLQLISINRCENGAKSLDSDNVFWVKVFDNNFFSIFKGGDSC